MKALLLSLSLMVPAAYAAAPAADPDSFSLNADQWSAPRSGRRNGPWSSLFPTAENYTAEGRRDLAR